MSTTSNSFQEENNGSVIIKRPSRSLRHGLRLFQRKHKLSKLSGGTAISTVCSLEEQQHVDVDPPCAPTISTTNGTEAIFNPQQESQYLYSQGMQLYEQHQWRDAIESLTLALSIVPDGLELEPKILWTLSSIHAKREEFDPASTYVTLLKPLIAKVQDEWIQQEASLPLLSLLMERNLWKTAWTMTLYLDKDTLDPCVLARIHLEVASSLSTSQEALPHLEQALEHVQQEDKDEPLKQAILQNMVHAHAAKEEWEDALSFQESYMDSIARGGDDDDKANALELAQGHFNAAQLYLAMDEYDEALACLQQGLQLVPSHKHGLATKMLQAKAHVLLSLGRVDESLAIYKSLVAKLKQPSDVAKIYYTMACICCKNGRFDESLGYFKKELKITRNALGKHHVETCRIYQDMARMYDESLGDYETSLKYYTKALKVQQRALKKCTNPMEQRELSSHILETQQCMGRIHYKRGEFTQALHVSFQENVAV